MGYLRVAKQLQRVDGRFELLEPKTVRSRRTLAIPPAIIDALREHRIRQEEQKLDGAGEANRLGLVFTRSDGGPLDGTVVTHQFHRLLDRAGIPQRRFHDLRHSYATLLLVQDVPARVVMEILGHSQISLTMNTYTHVLPELNRAAARGMQKFLDGAGKLRVS